MKWAFVDYENVGSLDRVNLADYQRLFVFCGPKNKSIKFDSIPADGICHIELLSIMTGGPDNLDFHLAFHLGKEHQIAAAGVEFHIVSNDTGFNGLVNHVKRLGRRCARLGSIAPPNTAAGNTKSKAKAKVAEKITEIAKPISEPAVRLFQKLKELDGRVRTKKKDRLLGWLKSNLPALHLNNPPTPDSILQELIGAKCIVVSADNAVTYNFSQLNESN